MADKYLKQCKTCIHSRVCYLKSNRENYTGILQLTPCEYYKSELKTIDLPCSIGDKAFIVKSSKNDYKWIVEKTVSGIHITDKVNSHHRDQPTYYLVVRSDLGYAQHIDMKEIGKTVFFDEYEAHKVVEGVI